MLACLQWRSHLKVNFFIIIIITTWFKCMFTYICGEGLFTNSPTRRRWHKLKIYAAADLNGWVLGHSCRHGCTRIEILSHFDGVMLIFVHSRSVSYQNWQQIGRSTKVGDHVWCPQGARWPNHHRWPITFGVLRLPDCPDCTGPGNKHLLEAFGEISENPSETIKIGSFFLLKCKIQTLR